MSATVNLAIKANVLELSHELNHRIETGIKQSSCWLLDTFQADHGMQYRIKAFSDKLEKLHDFLGYSGIELLDSSKKLLENAAVQYSVFRDIEITLVVNELPKQLGSSTLIHLASGVI